jgi:hypothetical protein
VVLLGGFELAIFILATTYGAIRYARRRARERAAAPEE